VKAAGGFLLPSDRAPQPGRPRLFDSLLSHLRYRTFGSPAAMVFDAAVQNA